MRTEESARHNSTPDGGRCNQFGHSCETNKGSGQDGKENDAQSGYPLNGYEGRTRLGGDDLMLGRVKQEAGYSNGKLVKGLCNVKTLYNHCLQTLYNNM